MYLIFLIDQLKCQFQISWPGVALDQKHETEVAQLAWKVDNYNPDEGIFREGCSAFGWFLGSMQ